MSTDSELLQMDQSAVDAFMAHDGVFVLYRLSPDRHLYGTGGIEYLANESVSDMRSADPLLWATLSITNRLCVESPLGGLTLVWTPNQGWLMKHRNAEVTQIIEQYIDSNELQNLSTSKQGTMILDRYRECCNTQHLMDACNPRHYI